MNNEKFLNYRIFCKKGNWVAAIFNYFPRATAWLENLNPKIYSDKTLVKSDFLIQGSCDFKNWTEITLLSQPRS